MRIHTIVYFVWSLIFVFTVKTMIFVEFTPIKLANFKDYKNFIVVFATLLRADVIADDRKIWKLSKINYRQILYLWRTIFEKLKAGIFDGPQVRTLIKYDNFINHMTRTDSKAWMSFVAVVQFFLGNLKALDYKAIATKILQDFKASGANMSIKFNYWHSHLDKFPDNLCHYSEEQQL